MCDFLYVAYLFGKLSGALYSAALEVSVKVNIPSVFCLVIYQSYPQESGGGEGGAGGRG